MGFRDGESLGYGFSNFAGDARGGELSLRGEECLSGEEKFATPLPYE